MNVRHSDGRPLTRQEQLLLLVEQRTEVDDNGELQRFYTPNTKPETLYIGGRGFDIGIVAGAGDSAAFRALESKGLIERVTHGDSMRYWYRITEDGMLRAQELC